MSGYTPEGGTLYPDLGSYLKIGYYRNADIAQGGTAFFDGRKVGESAESVGAAGIGTTAAAAPVVDRAWDRLAQCESGGDWAADADGRFGGLRFTPQAWAAHGGTESPRARTGPPASRRSRWPAGPVTRAAATAPGRAVRAGSGCRHECPVAVLGYRALARRRPHRPRWSLPRRGHDPCRWTTSAARLAAAIADADDPRADGLRAQLERLGITVSGNEILHGGEPWWFLGYNSFVWSGDCGQ